MDSPSSHGTALAEFESNGPVFSISARTGRELNAPFISIARTLSGYTYAHSIHTLMQSQPRQSELHHLNGSKTASLVLQHVWISLLCFRQLVVGPTCSATTICGTHTARSHSQTCLATLAHHLPSSPQRHNIYCHHRCFALRLSNTNHPRDL